MKPLLLKAPCKDYLWGGTKLKEEFGKVCELPVVAESWELSCHKDGCSVIENGEYAGMELPTYLKKNPDALGEKCKDFPDFPVLIKLIDAKQNLSVQVHPGNEYAMQVEGEYGKTEMWYVVDCEPDAKLLYGFQKEISKLEFRERIENNTLLEVLNAVPVCPGDVFFIEAGTLHAIGAGILIAEIQQNSNTTYRVYDYGRIGVDGKPRQLHIEKALDVTKLEPPKRKAGAQGETESLIGGEKTLLASCQYFTVDKMKVNDKLELSADNDSFHAILCLSGQVNLYYKEEKLLIHKGQTVFIPAGLGSYQLDGECELLLTRL